MCCSSDYRRIKFHSDKFPLQGYAINIIYVFLINDKLNLLVESVIIDVGKVPIINQLYFMGCAVMRVVKYMFPLVIVLYE